jgi:hypothetical protein
MENSFLPLCPRIGWLGFGSAGRCCGLGMSVRWSWWYAGHGGTLVGKVPDDVKGGTSGPPLFVRWKLCERAWGGGGVLAGCWRGVGGGGGVWREEEESQRCSRSHWRSDNRMYHSRSRPKRSEQPINATRRYRRRLQLRT